MIWKNVDRSDHWPTVKQHPFQDTKLARKSWFPDQAKPTGLSWPFNYGYTRVGRGSNLFFEVDDLLRGERVGLGNDWDDVHFVVKPGNQGWRH